MRILILSDLMNSGGASTACNRIADSIKIQNHDVIRVATDAKTSPGNNEFTLFIGQKILLVEQFLRRMTGKQLTGRRKKEWCIQFKRLLKFINPEFISIHNLHSSGLPIDLVQVALRYAPVAWTLHDCHSFSGSYCPTHTPLPKDDFLNEIKYFWHGLNNGEDFHSLTAIAPSTWIKSQACNSLWKDEMVKTIHNPVPDSYFESRDRIGCKRALGLEDGKPIILCISGDLKAKHKGGWILEEIIDSISSKEAQFLLVGDGCFNFPNSKKVKRLGFVRDELTLQIAYNAADLLIHPAPIDNLPNTVAEAMSCGTPVLAFDTGGLPEMVVPEKSGWLVEKICQKSLMERLISILSTRDYEKLREGAKAHAQELFDSKLIADQYLENFSTALAKKYEDISKSEM